jgi:hypothetical protein
MSLPMRRFRMDLAARAVLIAAASVATGFPAGRSSEDHVLADLERLAEAGDARRGTQGEPA